MNRRIRLLAILAMILFVVTACQSKEGSKQQSIKQLSVLGNITEQTQSLTSHQYKDNHPQLEGGSETVNRKTQATANHILRKKYPHKLYLNAQVDEKKVALTFDDGPDKRFTPKVLDVLKNHHVKATFFVMGARAKGHPDIVKRIVKEGHAIGNHTYWHPNLVKISHERIEKEVKDTEAVIAELTGVYTRLFRAPYGSLTEDIVEKLASLNYSIFGWSVDSLDWRQLPPKEISINVLSDVHPGAIILYHDGGDWSMDLSGTIQSVDYVITTLKEKGYEFVTVPELLNIEGKK